MATVNLFTQPVFRDGALTAADPAVRRFALRKTTAAIDIGAELGAPIFVLWGGREGVESAAARDPRVALERYREGDRLPLRVRPRAGTRRCASRSRPSRTSRAATCTCRRPGTCCTSSRRSSHPEMVGVNPEMAHEAMAGLSFSAAVGQALWAGKLFHVDLNAQNGPRYDQDFRFGAEDLKEAFLTVRLLERSGYAGSAPLRRARLPQRGRRRRLRRLRARLHPQLQDPRREGNGFRFRPGDSARRARRLEPDSSPSRPPPTQPSCPSRSGPPTTSRASM